MTVHETSLEALGAPRADIEETLRPLVTCAICLELYVNPVALLNCLHLACGLCAKEWLECSSTCHQCRGSVSGKRDSHHTAALVEAYLFIAPNSSLSQGRPPEEINSIHEKYQPGQDISIKSDDVNRDDEWEPYDPASFEVQAH